MPAATKDAVLDTAVDLAREAAEAVAGDPSAVGEHLGVVAEDERVVSHRFASALPGYVGWAWTVTLTRVPRGRAATVCEVDLLPGDDALLAPAWVPWADRLRPGDLGAGDELPYRPDDDRLDQGYEATGDLDADEVALFELGLGRVRVLSRTGRSEAAERWYAGSHGPMAPVALAAGAPCSTCGFLVLLAGSLRTEFGVCANEWSPDDGRVVSMDHGCGAHSETDLSAPPSDWPDPVPMAEPLDTDPLPEEAEVEAEVEVEPEAEVEEPAGVAEAVEPDAVEADVVEPEVEAEAVETDVQPEPDAEAADTTEEPAAE